MPERDNMQRVPVKVYRADDRITVAAPMPGLLPGDITVEVAGGNVLVLEGELRGTLKDDKEVLLDEWQAGSYRREVTLPEAVDGQAATATYGNGMLVVALPLAERARVARFTLEEVAPGRGERVGSAGHPVRPLTTEQHRGAKRAVHAEHGGGADPHG